MSTRSIICVKTTSGVRAIYCHWDGYLSGVGQTLFKHYSSQSRVEQLVALGNLSSLGKCIEPSPASTHSFIEPQENVCVAYERDRGELGQEAEEFNDVSSMVWFFDEPYYYMWTFAGWQVKIGAGVWLPLAQVLAKEVA